MRLHCVCLHSLVFSMCNMLPPWYFFSTLVDLTGLHCVAPLFCLLCAQHNGSIVLLCYVFLYVHFFTSSIPPSLLVLYFCLLHFLILCVNFFHCLSSSIWFFFDDLFLHFFRHTMNFFCTSASTTTLPIQHKLGFFVILWTYTLPSTLFFYLHQVGNFFVHKLAVNFFIHPIFNFNKNDSSKSEIFHP